MAILAGSALSGQEAGEKIRVILENSRWVERPDNQRHIFLWEDFGRDAIMRDF